MAASELVSLEREKNNPYDKNAIKVNNIYGQQVGHIKREMAVCLSQIMDKNLCTIEGYVYCIRILDSQI